MVDKDIDWMKVTRIALVPYSMVILALVTASLCGTAWLHHFMEVDPFVDTEQTIGLWVACSARWDYGIKSSQCVISDDNVEDFIQVTRSFLIIASISCLMCTVTAMIFNRRANFKGIYVTLAFTITASFLLIAMTTFTASINDDDLKYGVFKYGWSHNIGWLAFVLSVIGALISLLFGVPKLPAVYIEFQK